MGTEQSEKDKVDAELKQLKAMQKGRQEIEKKKAEAAKLRAELEPPKSAPSTKIGERASALRGMILPMLARNHGRNGWILLGFFCGLFTQFFF